VQLEEGRGALLEPGGGGAERVAERRPGRFVGGSLAKRGERVVAERVERRDDDVLLGREQAEQGAARDADRFGEFVRRHGVEAALGEQTERLAGDLGAQRAARARPNRRARGGIRGHPAQFSGR
jgi:hypothetical protein